MPVNSYSVLCGDPQPGTVSGPAGKPPHYLIPVNAGGKQFQVAVNIESDDTSEVLYLINPNFTPPDATLLTSLSQGMTRLTAQANPALDFVRSRVNGQSMLERSEMQLLPIPNAANSDDLHSAVIMLLNQATADPNGLIYAFGGQYTDGTGIHEIHMNQGNATGDHDDENGIWQDGALLFYLPASLTWRALFICFQQQSWNTDDRGYPL